ncbi:S-protein homolog 2-like [Papaver somniferum]|uniref:S-protein homolog 2-like n=1 Tax=Papaver somniferum TaxID=3469 RepID=UPI000E7017DC|nr:S-protein homolog 2-like [Papaver somniferum]
MMFRSWGLLNTRSGYDVRLATIMLNVSVVVVGLHAESFINLLALITLPFQQAVPVSKCYSIFGQVTVHVQNDIESEDVLLLMHCKSSDDDLGGRFLYQGQEWHWEFGIFPGQTFFSCDFRWYNNQDHHWCIGNNFEVYLAEPFIEHYRGYCDKDCQWSARHDGFYLYRRDKKEWEKRNEWDCSDEEGL